MCDKNDQILFRRLQDARKLEQAAAGGDSSRYRDVGHSYAKPFVKDYGFDYVQRNGESEVKTEPAKSGE